MSHWKRGYGCPYCGKDANDEDDYTQDNGIIVLTCASCGKVFKLQTETVVNVWTRKMRQVIAKAGKQP